ncbi:MAG TPA: transglycosylase SLT domain-containing protein [Candidatus Acidoferrales bacterium]|nr:transglycosylase SLT domain-containing protein [Candidatus Acidoferrales bacterium]
MRDKNPRIGARAYAQLAALARHWTGVERSRAALVLGHYEYTKGGYASAREWFLQARHDPLLGSYSLYWEGLAAGAAGQDADAIALLGQFRQENPDSVMTEPALAAYADAAINANQPERAFAALSSYPAIQNSPRLLNRLATAEEKAGTLLAAGRDFERVYNQYPLNEAAADAEKGIDRLRQRMGGGFTEAPLADRLSRAETLYKNSRWKDARSAYERLVDSLAAPERDQAALRIAECDARITRNSDALETIALAAPQLDAERWVALAGAYRSREEEDRMVAAVEQAAKLDGSGPWGEQALFLAGNYYWAHLKRDRAVEFYRRLLATSASGADVANADWRIAWTAYLEGGAAAQALLEKHVERFPNSPQAPDALYWLGRLAERAGDLPDARAYYGKVSERFAETYFARAARDRLRNIGQGPPPAAEPPAIAAVPPLAPATVLADDVPAGARPAFERAEALSSIAFDESALEELRAAYRSFGAPELLIAAARAAQAAEHYLTGAALVRQLVPDLESRPMASVPEAIWRIVYPLPFAPLIRESARRNEIDPMLLASLVRQESGFQADAVSSAGAVGLSQLEPRTARKWSRILRLRYSRKRLDDSGYNLRVGAAYFQNLIESFGSPEAALAAYNAGEDRVAVWRADAHGDDPAEFVESIPFSETRHYVEVVMDGAAIYRRLYPEGR